VVAPAHRFTVGDRVRARYTLTEMVIEDVYALLYLYRYVCSWTTAAGVARRDLFRADDLTPVPADGSPQK